MIRFYKIPILICTLFCLYACQEKESQKPPTPTEAKQVTEARYFCPMKCEGFAGSSEPGKCSVCGMDLIDRQSLSKPVDKIDSNSQTH